MMKRHHENCLPYIDNIPDIIASPDYIGVNPNEPDPSIELVKIYKDNVLVGIKLDKETDTLYVSTMYALQESKLKRRLHSGRLKPYKG